MQLHIIPTNMASPTELTLDCKPTIESLVLKPYVEHDDAADQETQKLQEFVARLEEEKLKINPLKRELPICMQLLTNAMEALRQKLQLQRLKVRASPAVEDFVSVNKSSSSSSSLSDKAEWMASATLWNQEYEGGGGASGRENLVGRKEKRKARRCWSPHLHKRFLNALHMLGGSKATPKQITQLMKVEGLTNDEVKSHLQKYRLQARIQTPNPLVVVGGIWVPPPYATAAHGGAALCGPRAAATRRVALPSSLDHNTCSFMQLC